MASYRNSDPVPPIMRGSPPALVPPRMYWDRPPWNRWSFQHIREILPTAEIWRGTGPVRELARHERDLSELQVKGLKGGDVTLAQFLDETYTDGFLLLHKGAVVSEQYFNGMGPRSLHLSQSVAKSFTGMIAGILIGRGVLDAEAPVTSYLPELMDTGWRDATLQQVLDMTTGTRFSEEYTNPYSDIGQVDVASGWKPVPPDSDPSFVWPPHMWALITGLKDTERPHGSLFAYRSIETDVLAFCMERVTSKRLPQIFSEELWQKMGADESANFTVDSAGYALADGGLNACLRDYGRFGQLILAGGGGIIPSAWIEATRNGNHAIFKEPYTSTLPHGAYRNQFWIEDPVSRNLMCRGVFGQLIWIDFAREIVAVKLSSWPDFLDTAKSNVTLAALHQIAAVLQG